jgi:hypothetical protein
METIRKKKAAVGVEDASSAMGLPPDAKLRCDFSVAVTGTHSSRWIHDDLSIPGALELDQVIRKAKLLELGIGEALFRHERYGQPGRPERNESAYRHSSAG